MDAVGFGVLDDVQTISYPAEIRFATLSAKSSDHIRRPAESCFATLSAK